MKKIKILKSDFSHLLRGFAPAFLCAGLLSLVPAVNTFAATAGSPATIYSGVRNTHLSSTASGPASASITIGQERIMGDSPTLDASDDSNAGKYYYRIITANVSNVSSYTLSMQGVSTNLTSENGYTIPSVTNDVAFTNMPANHWGYNIGNETPSGSTVFSAMPTGTPTPFYSSGNGAGSINEKKEMYISFAAKVDKRQPEGTYSNRVVVSIVAQPVQVATFSGITTMQQMTSSICSAARTHDTTRLRDTRDGRFYWVTKLADGNCWMSQNLQLYLGSASPLNSATSDLGHSVYSWTPQFTTTSSLVEISSAGKYHRTQRSWTQGLYVLNTPTLDIDCGNNTEGQGLATSGCKTAGFVKVGNDWIYENGIATNRTTGGINNVRFVASSDPNFFVNNGGYAIAVEKDSSGRMRTDSSGNPIFKTNSSGYVEFDAHYLVGNWYTWNTAIAGGDGGGDTLVSQVTDGATAPDSICPKNWKLPTSGTDRDNTSGSFNYLLRAYGVNNSPISSSSPTYDIAQAPLFFVRSGLFTYYGHINAGDLMRYWSSRSGTGIYDHSGLSLTVENSETDPSSPYIRIYGFGVRCVAR